MATPKSVLVVPEPLIKAVRRKIDDPEAQAEALTALLTISYHPVNVLAFTTEGGLSTVLKAMARHPAHAGVQEAGCAVLRNLAVDGETVRRIVVDGGAAAVLVAMRAHVPEAAVQYGAASVLAAMRAHVPQAAVQVEALGALRNLASEASNRVKLVALGVIPPIMGVLRKHPDVCDLVEQACGVLRNLAVDA
ncbi:armadillo-type protein, partial [Baffinella frigidus]